MISENIATVSTYTGNDVAFEFAFYFRALKASDILVTATIGLDPAVTLVQGVDYSYAYSSFPLLGGTVTLIENGQAWMTGATLKQDVVLIVQYVVAPSQASNLRTVPTNQLALAVEKAIDKIAMDLKGLQEQGTTGSSTSSAAVTFPTMVDKAGKLAQVNADEDGFEYITDASSIQAAANAAAASEEAAALSETSANNSEAASLVYKNAAAIDRAAVAVLQGQAVVSVAQAAQHVVDAGISKVAAAASAVSAAAQVPLAEAQVVLAEDAALESEKFAGLILYTSTVALTFADSPYQVLAADDGKLFQIDTTGGNFVFNFPTIQADVKWRVSAVKTDSSVNTITVNPYGADTINGAASDTMTEQIYGQTYYRGTFSNWLGRAFIDNSSFNVGSPGNAGGYSFSAIQNIIAGGTIIPGNTIQQIIEVQGNGGPQSANAVPFSANVNDGYVITLAGQDDAKILKISHNDAVDGCLLKGDCYLGLDDILCLVRDETRQRYRELFRSVH